MTRRDQWIRSVFFCFCLTMMMSVWSSGLKAGEDWTYRAIRAAESLAGGRSQQAAAQVLPSVKKTFAADTLVSASAGGVAVRQPIPYANQAASRLLQTNASYVARLPWQVSRPGQFQHGIQAGTGNRYFQNQTSVRLPLPEKPS